MDALRKLLLGTIVVSAYAVASIQAANAHAISIGFENAGPGSVNVWLGTYEHGGHHIEGSLSLQGVNGTVYGPTVNPFTLLTPTGIANKPAGLIDGVTNFYPSTPLGVPGPLTGNPSIWESFCPACGPVNHWEGVNFTGLSVGDYQFTYVPIAFPTAEWDPWNSSLLGIFTLSGQVVNPGTGVPEPASLLLIAGGLAGFASLRRRKVAKSYR